MIVKKNAIANAFLYFFKYIIPFATFPYLTRVLSKEKLGNVFFIDSIAQYFLIFVTAGIPLYAIREIAKASNCNEKRNRIAFELITFQFVLSLIAIFIFILASQLLSTLEPYKLLIKIGCISILCSSFTAEWYFQAIGKYEYITYRTLIIKLLLAFSIFIFVKTKNDNIIYYFLTNIAILLNAVVNFLFLIKSTKFSIFKSVNFRHHLKPLRTFFLLNFSVSIYTIFDTIILGFLTDSVAISLYNVPLKIIRICCGFILSIGFVLIPEISKYHEAKQANKIEALLSKMVNIILTITVPLCLFFILFSKEIITTVSGSSYVEAHLILIILSPLPLIIGICNALGSQFLIPTGREKKLLQATVAALIISVIANLLLIPSLNYIGTAIVCLFTEFFVCGYVYYHSKNNIRLNIDKKLLLNICISTTISTLIYTILKMHFKGPLLIFINIITYSILFISNHFFIFKSRFLNDILDVKKYK